MKLFALCLVLAGSLFGQTAPANLDDDFDKPVKKTILDFGPSPYYPPTRHIRKTLTCFYYSDFTVKQYDEGQMGAEWLSIVPSGTAGCTRVHRKDEKVFVGDDPWNGYFWGAKGALVFFAAPDSQSGGELFAVFDFRTGKKLFEDSSLSDYYVQKLHLKHAFRVVQRHGEIAQLTYFRVVETDCNLHANAADCWQKARAEFGIIQTEIPVCSDYEKADWDSAIVYPVSVRMNGSPKIKAAEGPVFCWPRN